MQPIAELMVAKLGFVFHHNGLEWSRNAIVHLRNRARTMPCHRLGEFQEVCTITLIVC
jgi:hypothetical protein